MFGDGLLPCWSYQWFAYTSNRRFLSPSWRRWLDKVKQELHRIKAAEAAAPDRRTASQRLNSVRVSYQNTRSELLQASSQRKLEYWTARTHLNELSYHPIWVYVIYAKHNKVVFTCRVEKKQCVFRFPRQPLGRIVACADLFTSPVNQKDGQLPAATRGTKKVFPQGEYSRILSVIFRTI